MALASFEEQCLLALAAVFFLFYAADSLFWAESIPYGTVLWPQGFVAILLGLYASARCLRTLLFRLRLASPAPIALKEIPRKAGFAYLGHAFEWTREHLELYYELDQKGIHAPEHNHQTLSGDWRIHAVGNKPAPLFMPVRSLNQHKLIVSTTGGGKSRALELDILQAMDRGDALVVIDPKGDDRLLARVEEGCRLYGREFVFVGLPYPGHSATYNPVADYVQAHEIADRISLILPGRGDSQTFKDYAWGVINTVVNGMRLAKDEPITLNKIKRHAFGDTWALFERVLKACYASVYHRDKSFIAKWHGKGDIKSLEGWYQSQKRNGAIPQSDELDELVKLIVHPREHYQKMVASLWPKLSMLTSGHLARLLSPQEADEKEPRRLRWDDVDRHGQVVYFYLGSLLGYTTANAVAAMTILDLISYVGKRYAYQSGVSERRLTIVVDELADVIQPAFTNLLNKSRGANVSLIMAVQSLSELQAKLGTQAEAQGVLANVNTLIQMLVKNETDAQAFSQMTGKVQIRRMEESYRYEPAMGDAGLAGVAGHRASFGQSFRTIETELVPTSLLQRLCIGHFFASQNGKVYKGIIPLLPDPAPGTIERLKSAGVLAHVPAPAEEDQGPVLQKRIGTP